MTASAALTVSLPADPKTAGCSSLARRRRFQLTPQSDLGFTTDGKAPAVVMPRRPPRQRIRKMDHDEKIYDYFYWEEVIQEDGDGGKVVLCRKKSEETKEYNYVLKIRTKASIGSLKDQEEFRGMLMKMLNISPHSGVIPYLEVLEDDKRFYCVMERAAGGSLPKFLLTKHADGCVPELEMKELMQEILEALGHVHEQGMIHRDIKLDNIVVRQIDDPSSSSNGKSTCVTLIDFDHAETNYSPCTPKVDENVWGTTGYSAPETYLGHFSPASDLFSVGVILYVLMTGKMPYDVKMLRKAMEAKSSQDWCTHVYYKMLNVQVDWSCDPWPQNKCCRSFCQTLLASKPHLRPASVEQALGHKWLANTRRDHPRTPPSPSRWLEAALPKKKRGLEGSGTPMERSQSKDSLQVPTLNPTLRKNVKDIVAGMRKVGIDSDDLTEPRLPSPTPRNVKDIIHAMRAVDFHADNPNQHLPMQPVLPVANEGTYTKLEEEVALSFEIETPKSKMSSRVWQPQPPTVLPSTSRSRATRRSSSSHSGSTLVHAAQQWMRTGSR